MDHVVHAPSLAATPTVWVAATALVFLAVLSALTRMITGDLTSWSVALCAIGSISTSVLGVGHWHDIQLTDARDRALDSIERVYDISVMSGHQVPYEPRESVQVLARVDGELIDCQIGVDPSAVYVVACEEDGHMAVLKPATAE